MGKILTREEAWALLNEYNKEPFHLRHGETVEGVMRYLAQELGYGDEVDFWGNVGLLHDLDFEQWPEEHCAKVQELMVMVSVWMWYRNMRWRKFCLPQTN